MRRLLLNQHQNLLISVPTAGISLLQKWFRFSILDQMCAVNIAANDSILKQDSNSATVSVNPFFLLLIIT